MSENLKYGTIGSSYAMLYVDDVSRSKSIMVERCPICNGTKRTFYCSKCVNTGQFFRSESLDSKISFDTKKELLHKFKEANQELQYKLNKQLSHKEFFALKYNEKISIQLNIINMKAKIDKYKRRIKENQSNFNELLFQNKEALKNSNLMKVKLDRIKNHLIRCPQSIDTTIINLRRCKFDLMNCRQDHIKDLIRDIFPIRRASNKEDPDFNSNPCINLLSDARNTEYVKGEWVLSKSEQNGNQVFQIIEALLPSNGLYDKNKYNIDNHIDINESISPALCLLAQITSIIAIILDSYLSFNISLKDFSLSNDKLFSKSVTKLNRNVFQLCEMQHISMCNQRPEQTILNLFKIFDYPRLGSDEPNMLQDEEMQDSVSNESIDILDLSSDSNENGYVADLNDHEWEYVPVSLPEVEMSIPGQTSASYFSSTILQNGQTELQATMTNIASGLVSSASMLWKGWNTKNDK